MKEVPLDARVECTDGRCGKSITVIVHRMTREVTYFVIKPPHSEARLVPMSQVAETSHDLVRLRCTRDELAAMEPFIETRFIEVDRDTPTAYGWDPYVFQEPYAVYAGDAIPVKEERIPLGDVAFHRGAQVEAVDGHAGEVGEFLIDPESGHITHLVLMAGHLWGKKEVTLPVSAIDRVVGDTVHLKLDRQAIKEMPSVPLRRHGA